MPPVPSSGADAETGGAQHALVTFLLLCQNTRTKATYKHKHWIGLGVSEMAERRQEQGEFISVSQ